MTVTIPLGDKARVTGLYSFPNSDTCPWTLAETVKHWFDMTLERDGLAAKGARASVEMDRKKGYVLVLEGPKSISKQLKEYSHRLHQFLKNGESALNTVVPKIKSDGRWDPSPDKPLSTYHPWRFFLPHGMAMLNQKALLFFHYPPIRLLDTNQDYLDDPVPVRCEELLTANGVPAADLPLFNTVMDATPIGAEDDQGSKKAGDPVWGLIPIQDFHKYQKAQVSLLLNDSPTHKKFTVPIVVYGAHPLATFNELYKCSLRNNEVGLVSIVPGKQTPVMASTHPYVFYGTAQGFDDIGSGKLVNLAGATSQMIKDLVVARWLKQMSDDPSQDPQKVLKSCTDYWNSSAQSAAVSALVQHQGSLKYSDKKTLTFEFEVPLPGPFDAPTAVPSPAPATARKAAPVKVEAATAPVSAASPSGGNASGTTNPESGLTVIGDSGHAVDWWFIYKVSGASTTPDGTPASGREFVYFDSEMAKDKSAKLTLSKNKIDDTHGPLFATLGQVFSDSAKANKQLGWYCYNDEDHQVAKMKNGKPLLDSDGKPEMSGTGPEDRGHCKGCLAFDLKTKTAFWLIHSVPLFPLTDDLVYPHTGLKMAQTMLCIQLKDDSVAKSIAQLMYDAHGPNVNVASDLLSKAAIKSNAVCKPGTKSNPYANAITDVPKMLAAADPKDARLLLMQDLNGSMSASKPYPPGTDDFKKAPYPGRVVFQSKGGTQFTAIAKNKDWGKDFYNDLVSAVLDQNLDVETWEDTTKVPKNQKPGDHKVEDMKAIDLTQLKTGIPFSWSESDDHAKLAISDRTNAAGTPRWVCVGDINYTIAQEHRGGGTVAFQCPPLWSSLAAVVEEAPIKPVGKPKKRKPATAAKSASKSKGKSKKK